MEMLLKTQTGDNELSDDDPQLSYMISAWARICKILGPRFAPYLPVVMPAIMKTASMKPEVSLTAQCGNFRIFLSLRFYVKSILENLEFLKLPFLPLSGL